jgi:hypothetical protein
MTRKLTSDHGEIIHFAGHHHLFPVALRADLTQVRLATREDVTPQELRVGWPVYFRAFIDRDLVFVHEGTSGQAMTRAEAAAVPAAAAAPAAVNGA